MAKTFSKENRKPPQSTLVASSCFIKTAPADDASVVGIARPARHAAGVRKSIFDQLPNLRPLYSVRTSCRVVVTLIPRVPRGSGEARLREPLPSLRPGDEEFEYTATALHNGGAGNGMCASAERIFNRRRKWKKNEEYVFVRRGMCAR